MSPATLSCAGRELARTRLAHYARIAELVAEQEAALDADDIERFEELGRSIGHLQSQAGASSGVMTSVGEDPEAASTAFVERATELLQATMTRSERIQRRLAARRRETGEEIRTLTRSRAPARRYVTESATAASPDRARLDVKF